ncbi:MAG TPA: hypothetical protein PKY82_10450 [Pyrinomonadaceae bacterium]|nr:hypothetical protein [Pyrinomonadaceae bacterium]
MNKIEKRLRYLEIYAIVSLLIFGVLAFSAWTKTREKFTEIDVERLNVREKNGQLLMVVANSDRMPDPIINGKTWKTERPPGMLFYNGLGDENGGLIFTAVEGGGKYGAYQGFSFDKFKQAQAMALVYNDHSGKYRAGLQIWDRPEIPLTDILTKREEINKMPDGEAKTTALKKLDEENFSPTRVYVGKNAEKESEVTLYDGNGKVRIKMSVSDEGTPKLDFLDANGKVIYSLPNDAKK